MLEEIFNKILDDAIGKYVPQYLTGELSLQETFDKVDGEVRQNCDSEEFKELFEKEIEKFADIKKIPYGDQKIFVVSPVHKPVKVVFEKPTWQLIEDEKNPALIEYRRFLNRIRVLHD